jgi:hypothetical protein
MPRLNHLIRTDAVALDQGINRAVFGAASRPAAR